MVTTDTGTPTSEVTIRTNRCDLFAAAWSITIRELVDWNLDYFALRRRFWLGVGDRLRIEPPTGAGGLELLVRDEVDSHILVVDAHRLTVLVEE